MLAQLRRHLNRSALALTAIAATFLPAAHAVAGEPLKVVVSVPPLTGLVTPLLPDDAEVVTLIPPGSSPHGHKLRPSDLATLAGADLVVLNGLGVETGLESAIERTNKPGRTVLVLADIAGIDAKDAHHDCDDHGHSHDHAHGEDCDHGALDPHLWFGFDIVRKLQTEVAKAVGTPSEQLAAAIDAVNQAETDAHAALSKFKGSKVVTQHDAYRRLFEPFEITQVAVIRPIETAEPTAEDLRTAVEAVRTGGAVAVFVEPQMPRAAAERVARAGGVPVGQLDPLGAGDWHALIRANVASLVDTLSAGG